VRRAGLALLLAVGLCLPAAAAWAQDGSGQVPTQDIIPEPDSGASPDDAGDRGGGLQLLVLGIVLLAVAGGGWHIARQARRGRVPS
jgi:hypothetical protein